MDACGLSLTGWQVSPAIQNPNTAWTSGLWNGMTPLAICLSCLSASTVLTNHPVWIDGNKVSFSGESLSFTIPPVLFGCELEFVTRGFRNVQNYSCHLCLKYSGLLVSIYLLKVFFLLIKCANKKIKCSSTLTSLPVKFL